MYISIGLMAVLYNLLFSLTVSFFHTFRHEFHADIIVLSTSTSHPPVLLFLVFANFEIMSLPSIDFSLPVATDVLDSLIQYINLFLSTKFPLHKMCS